MAFHRRDSEDEYEPSIGEQSISDAHPRIIQDTDDDTVSNTQRLDLSYIRVLLNQIASNQLNILTEIQVLSKDIRNMKHDINNIKKVLQTTTIATTHATGAFHIATHKDKE